MKVKGSGENRTMLFPKSSVRMVDIWHTVGLRGTASNEYVVRDLFVPHQNVADVVLLEDLVIDRQHGTAGVAKDHLHALILQGLHHHPGSGHRLGHRRRPLRSFALVLLQQKAPGFQAGARGHGSDVRHRPLHPAATATRMVAIPRPSLLLRGGH